MHQLDRHALSVLNLFREFDTFLESLETVCDMGCGTGEDITWWATLASRDDNPEPYNYHCFAVDRDPAKLAQVPTLPNITKLERDFTKPRILPRNVDFMWAHDCLQYSPNPLETLKYWNEQINVNGMLALSIPQHSGIMYNRYYNSTYNGCFYQYTATNLIYMLAINGFDCADAFLYKRFNDPWLHMCVYKSDVPPMDPSTTTLFDLAETKLLHWSVTNSINKNGYIKQEEIVMPWLDKNNYFIDWIMPSTEIPPEAGEAIVDGVFNKTVESTTTTIRQADSVTKKTDLLKPLGIMRTPKGRYVK